MQNNYLEFFAMSRLVHTIYKFTQNFVLTVLVIIYIINNI